nr:hypothetical protein [Tanacetum cinerariifolium]
MLFNKALADLGAGVSVMPYSTYTTLGLGDLIPTKLIVKLVDRTVKRPKGIVENVLIGPTIEEGEVIDTPIKEIVKTRHDDDKITNGIEDYPSFSEFDRKIHVNDAYNLRFFCIIVIEDIDHHRDEEIDDVIVGKEFCKEVGINAKRIEGMITIYNGNEEVTYQMVGSHTRFKHHTNGQCNKLPTLLKDAKMEEWLTRGHISVHEME